MGKKATVKVTEGKTEEAIIGFLKSLLEKEVVEAMLIPKTLPSQDGFAQTLVRNPEKLKGACVLSPTICEDPLQSQCQKSGKESRCPIKRL